MPTHKLLPLIFTAIILSSCTHRADNQRLIERTMSSASKIIETRTYSTIEHNGEQVIGEELTNNLDHFHKIDYYDSTGRLILHCTEYPAGGCTYELTSYYSERGKAKTSIMRYSNDYSLYYIKDYMRKEDGGLYEVVESEAPFKTKKSVLYEWDDQGRESKVVDGTKTTFSSYLPSDNDETVRSYKVIDSNSKDIVDMVSGLVEKGTEFYNSAGRCTHSIVHYYRYGYVNEIVEDIYTLDKEGNVIECLTKRQFHDDAWSVPLGIEYGTDEFKTYVQKEYLSKPLKYEAFINEYDRDEYGNITRERYKAVFTLKRREDVIYQYTYNEYGDWIKCVTHDPYSLISPIITVRTINYIR